MQPFWMVVRHLCTPSIVRTVSGEGVSCGAGARFIVEEDRKGGRRLTRLCSSGTGRSGKRNLRPSPMLRSDAGMVFRSSITYCGHRCSGSTASSSPRSSRTSMRELSGLGGAAAPPAAALAWLAGAGAPAALAWLGGAAALAWLGAAGAAALAWLPASTRWRRCGLGGQPPSPSPSSSSSRRRRRRAVGRWGSPCEVWLKACRKEEACEDCECVGCDILLRGVRGVWDAFSCLAGLNRVCDRCRGALDTLIQKKFFTSPVHAEGDLIMDRARFRCVYILFVQIGS